MGARTTSEFLEVGLLEVMIERAALTERERQVVLLYNELRSGPRIAQQLQVSTATIYTDLERAQEKLTAAAQEMLQERRDGRSEWEWLLEEVIHGPTNHRPRSPEFAENTYGQMERVRLPRANVYR